MRLTETHWGVLADLASRIKWRYANLRNAFTCRNKGAKLLRKQRRANVRRCVADIRADIRQIKGLITQANLRDI